MERYFALQSFRRRGPGGWRRRIICADTRFLFDFTQGAFRRRGGEIGRVGKASLPPCRPSPRTPLRGTRTCKSAENFRRAKSEWASKFLPGHWALDLQKFPLVRFRNCAWLCRANVPGAYSGGSPKGLPYPNRKDFLETRRGEACPSRRSGIWRAGQCPAPTVNLRRLFSQGRHAGPPAFHSDGTGQTKTVQQNEVLRQSSF